MSPQIHTCSPSHLRVWFVTDPPGVGREERAGGRKKGEEGGREGGREGGKVERREGEGRRKKGGGRKGRRGGEQDGLLSIKLICQELIHVMVKWHNFQRSKMSMAVYGTYVKS